MRLIQGAILPESRQVHLAEVFLSRLLYRVPSEGEQDSDEIQYDFYPDVVDLLLDKSKGKQISEQISEYVVERIGQSRDFQALVGDTAVDGIRSFATLPVSILRRMGGSYAWLAERIERLQFCEPEMVEIQPGKFWMGSPEDEKGRYDDENQHRVIIKYSFAISKYPVTFDEYDRFAESTGRRKPRDENWGRGKRPVINVSWFDAVDYAKWLSEQTGYKYRLPTETEWEYTARANTAMTPNTSTPYYFGNTINFNLAHFGDRSSGTVEVGKFPANAWGLYDMHGNVWEWTCSKYSKSYEYSEQTDLEEYDKRYWRVCRGGAWNSRYERDLRSAVRKMQRPYRSDKSLGFRLVRVLNSGSDSNR
jgi:formylglycine-generating enzyme required for sulfatase activity